MIENIYFILLKLGYEEIIVDLSQRFYLQLLQPRRQPRQLQVMTINRVSTLIKTRKSHYVLLIA